MLVSDLLHSCANERVAAAAIASIGGAFAEQIQSDAEDFGVSVGVLTADVVRNFARCASERDWRELHDAVKGEDVPVLRGLQVILTKPDRFRHIKQRALEVRMQGSKTPEVRTAAAHVGFGAF